MTTLARSSLTALVLLQLAGAAFAFQAPPPGRVLADAGPATSRPPGGATVGPKPARWRHDRGRPLGPALASDPEQAARRFLAAAEPRLATAAGDRDRLPLRFVDRDSAGTTHVGFEQVIAGLRVLDGYVRVDLDRAGRPIAASTGVPVPDSLAEPRPALAPAAALGRAAADIGLEPGALREAGAPELVWLPWGEGLRLAWRVEVVPPGYPARYELVIDAGSGERLRRRNLLRYADTRATVFRESPSAGPRSNELLIDATVNVDPIYPAGWLDLDRSVGNNTVVQDDRAGDDEVTPGLSAQATPGTPQQFAPPYIGDPQADLEMGVVNLFWGINEAHRYFYRLGFDEAAGNFQTDNFGRGGAGGDAVRGDAQDEASTLFDADPGNDVDNNANFFTPSDGQPGRMQMYLWRMTTPWRDGDLDLDIVIHEFAHGVSNRLVGGRRDAGCLAGTQSGAMGEAWSDFFAGSWFDDPLLAEYSTGNASVGIRTARMDADSYSYGDLCRIGAACEVHDDGEIWAQALWELRSSLIAVHGPGSGRDIAEQLVIDGMRLAPCDPSFLDMRDAILLGDELRHAGAHHCLLWQVFAESGMGAAAADSTGGDETRPVEDFSLSIACDPAVGAADVRWQFDRRGCDTTAVVRVVDADLVLPETLMLLSDTGDALILPLAPGPAGPPVFVTAPFPVQGVASPTDVILTDAILQAVRGDTLVASYRDWTSGSQVEDFATLVCLADVRLAGHRIAGGTCDDDTVPGFPELPGFLDPGESAVLELRLENHEEFPIDGASLVVSSSNPRVTLVPVGARTLPTLPGRVGRDPHPVVARLLATADPSIAPGESADLALTFAATGFDGTVAPLSLTLRLGYDYEVQARSLSESFEPGSPTLASWSHAPLKATPAGDEWRIVTCKSGSPVQAYKNGGGDPGCGNYSDAQGDPYLASPPFRIEPSGSEAGRLVRVRYQHEVRLARPVDPFGGVCDAEAIGVLLSNDPATIDTSDPFALIDQALALYTVIPALGLDDNTTGFVGVDLDLAGRDFPGVDRTRDTRLTWVFAVDVSNSQVPFCGSFPAVGEGYYLDDVVVDWEEVRAVPETATCAPTCMAMAESIPAGATACAGAPIGLSGVSSLVAGCSSGLEYRWSGGELGAGAWGASPEVSVSPLAPMLYQLDVRCAADPACADLVEVRVGAGSLPPSGGPIGNALLVARLAGELHFDWSARPLAPRRYNLHRAASRTEVDDGVIGSMPVDAVVDDAETRDLPIPASDMLWEVYGRDVCTGNSVIP